MSAFEEEEGDEEDEGEPGRAWISSGSHMLNRVLSALGTRQFGSERWGWSSGTMGPRRAVFWVVK